MKKIYLLFIMLLFIPKVSALKLSPNAKSSILMEASTGEIIYSYNEKGLNTDDFVEQYIMTQLNIIQHYIHTNNLFELLSYELKKLDDYNNYLFIIKPIPFDELKKWGKLFIFICIPILILTIIILNIYI